MEIKPNFSTEMDVSEIDKLDTNIKDIVLFLRENGFETFESCEGGAGHCFPEPTVRFHGDEFEGIRAAYVCLSNKLPIHEVRRAFTINSNEIHTPFWEITFKRHDRYFHVSLDEETGKFQN